MAQWCTRGVKAGPYGQIQEMGYQIGESLKAGSDRPVSGYTEHCNFLCMMLHSHRAVSPLSTAKSTNYGHVSSRTGPWRNGRRWSGLMNPIFFHITWMVSCVRVAYLYTLSWKQYSLMAVVSLSRIMRPATKQTNWIYGGPTSQLTGLKGPVAGADTTAHFQRSGGLYALMAQGDFDSKRGANIKLSSWS